MAFEKRDTSNPKDLLYNGKVYERGKGDIR